MVHILKHIDYDCIINSNQIVLDRDARNENEIGKKKKEAFRILCAYKSNLKYPDQPTGCQRVEDYYNLSPRGSKIYF